MVQNHYTVFKHDKKARLGILRLERGSIRTPAFMPVGTGATVKAMKVEDIYALGADVILGNTYHLMLRPGTDTIKAHGGMHHFMQWKKPILTDSGGYQVFSLAKIRTIKEEGVYFQSHIDGSKHLLSPEKSMQVQHALNSDIQMVLDECITASTSRDNIAQSTELSLRWARRSKDAFYQDGKHLLFGIVQGGLEEDIRRYCTEALMDINFDGYAIGGLSVGEDQHDMLRIVDAVCTRVDSTKPRYLMGVGTPQDIILSVQLGVDMFDCVMPSRAGRHGLAFCKNGKVNLRNSVYKNDTRPLDETSDCPIANTYSRSYLHHLIKSKEILASMLLTQINLHYYQSLMSDIRQAIFRNEYDTFVKMTLQRLNANAAI